MPKTERVAEWMTENPVTVTPDFSVLAAYERMRARGIRRMPVVDKDGKLVGIITRSDIEQVMNHPRSEEERRIARFSLAGQTVAELMTPNPITVAANDSIGKAAAMMIRKPCEWITGARTRPTCGYHHRVGYFSSSSQYMGRRRDGITLRRAQRYT